MTPTMPMFNRILSLPVEKEQDHFTSAEVLNKKMIFRYESTFLDVQYFSSVV